MACTFSTSERQKVVRTRHFFLNLLTWKCASRHNGVHFFPKVVRTWCVLYGNVLRATRACTFSASQLPKVVRTWCVLYILTWKCASRHNGVQFFISQLASWLRTRRFSEVTFRPSGAPNHWNKHSKSWLSYLFAHLHLLASHSFSSLIFSFLDFSSLTLPASAFPSLHIVGSWTSKLPSGMIHNMCLFLPSFCRSWSPGQDGASGGFRGAESREVQRGGRLAPRCRCLGLGLGAFQLVIGDTPSYSWMVFLREIYVKFTW